jgi:hypothetical protein
MTTVAHKERKMTQILDDDIGKYSSHFFMFYGRGGFFLQNTHLAVLFAMCATTRCFMAVLHVATKFFEICPQKSDPRFDFGGKNRTSI